MSNERLERIKERVNYHDHLDDDIEFLIEQAERVQELEEGLLYYKMATESYVDMEQQNKRYREVVAEAISDLENECLWDALVKLKALEGEDESTT